MVTDNQKPEADNSALATSDQAESQVSDSPAEPEADKSAPTWAEREEVQAKADKEAERHVWPVTGLGDPC